MRWMKISALIALAIPIVVIFVLLVTETATGGNGLSFVHILQLLPLLLLAAMAWWFPKVSGWILISLGVAILAGYPVLAPPLSMAAVEMLDFLVILPVVAGILLVVGSRGSLPGPRGPK